MRLSSVWFHRPEALDVKNKKQKKNRKMARTYRVSTRSNVGGTQANLLKLNNWLKMAGSIGFRFDLFDIASWNETVRQEKQLIGAPSPDINLPFAAIPYSRARRRVRESVVSRILLTWYTELNRCAPVQLQRSSIPRTVCSGRFRWICQRVTKLCEHCGTPHRSIYSLCVNVLEECGEYLHECRQKCLTRYVDIVRLVG